MKRTIAPTLDWFLSAYGEEGDPKREEAERELRALKSAASALDRILRPHEDDTIPAADWDRGKRALSRLSPGSRPAGRSRR